MRRYFTSQCINGTDTREYEETTLTSRCLTHLMNGSMIFICAVVILSASGIAVLGSVCAIDSNRRIEDCEALLIGTQGVELLLNVCFGALLMNHVFMFLIIRVYRVALIFRGLYKHIRNTVREPRILTYELIIWGCTGVMILEVWLKTIIGKETRDEMWSAAVLNTISLLTSSLLASLLAPMDLTFWWGDPQMWLTREEEDVIYFEVSSESTDSDTEAPGDQDQKKRRRYERHKAKVTKARSHASLMHKGSVVAVLIANLIFNAVLFVYDTMVVVLALLSPETSGTHLEKHLVVVITAVTVYYRSLLTRFYYYKILMPGTNPNVSASQVVVQGKQHGTWM